METPGSFRSCTAVAAFAGALLTCPGLALAVGWIGWDFKTGGLAALVTLVSLVSTAAGLLILVREPSPWLASLPIVFGAAYAILPDPVLFTIDDGLVFTLGGVLSFLMWRKRRSDLPRWLILPVPAASAYTFIGGIIPGPLDEMLVYAISAGITGWKLSQPTLDAGSPPALPSPGNPPASMDHSLNR